MIVPQSKNLTHLLVFIAKPLAILFAFDMIVAIAYVYGELTWIALPHIPLTIFGGAIGVVVGFRNNSSYARWWEARKLWGLVVNYSRCIARQALTMIVPQPQDEDAQEAVELRRKIVVLQVAYVHALRGHLRQHESWPELERILPLEEVEQLRGQKNVPFAIQQRMAELLNVAYQRGWVDTIRWQAMDRTLTELANAQGGAERIKNTPMPKQYDFFPRVFVTVYILLLPFGLVANLQLLTPIGSALVGFIFLALDAIGRDLEAPFENLIHDVPLTSITRTIEINLTQVLGDGELPEPITATDGVLW